MDKLTKILTKALVLLLLTAIAFPSSLVSAASGVTFTKTTYQTTDLLNLRSTDSISSKKLTTIPKKMSLTSNYRIGEWYRVTYSGKTGYVLGQYLTKVVTGTSFTKTNYQTTDALSLRQAASTSSARLLTIPANTKLASSFRDGDWYKVTYNKQTGFVSGAYLKKVTASSTAYTTTERLNFRSAPTTSGALLMTIPSNQVVQSLSVSSNWHKINYGGKTGYVIGTYLKKGTASPAAPSAGNADYSGSKMYVLIDAGSTVALRSSASVLSGQLDAPRPRYAGCRDKQSS